MTAWFLRAKSHIRCTIPTTRSKKRSLSVRNAGRACTTISSNVPAAASGSTGRRFPEVTGNERSSWWWPSFSWASSCSDGFSSALSRHQFRVPRPRLCVGVRTRLTFEDTTTRNLGPVRKFGRRKNAARAGALAFRSIGANGLQGRSKSASTDEGTRPRSPSTNSKFAARNFRAPSSALRGHANPFDLRRHAHAEPWAWHPKPNDCR
jgi:hypothetical protein